VAAKSILNMTENNSNIISALEAVLFVADDPVSFAKLLELFDGEIEESALKQALTELGEMCRDCRRGISLVEVAGGYQFYTKPQNGEIIRKMVDKKKRAGISGAALESLAIVAYRQPISRAELNSIRGVNSEGVLHNLLEKRMIKIAGRKDVPGRPFLYRTTRQFLEYFGLNSITDLPKIEELARALERSEDTDLIVDENGVEEESVLDEYQEENTEQRETDDQEAAGDSG
jgi:segregation and condensation protein B